MGVESEFSDRAKVFLSYICSIIYKCTGARNEEWAVLCLTNIVCFANIIHCMSDNHLGHEKKEQQIKNDNARPLLREPH